MRVGRVDLGTRRVAGFNNNSSVGEQVNFVDSYVVERKDGFCESALLVLVAPNLSQNHIKAQLHPFMMGMTSKAVMFNPGGFIYRARKFEGSLDKQNLFIKDLHYKREDVGLGRANRDGRPVFYASQGKEPVLFELKVLENDELLIGNWQLNEPLYVQTIGYTAQVFINLGAARPCPVWQDPKKDTAERLQKTSIPDDVQERMREGLEKLRAEDPNFDVVSTFGSEFTRYDNKMYKISTAIAELHFGEVADGSLRFGGVLYPSIQMAANSDNFAILPWYADQHLTLKGVQHVRVTHRQGHVITCQEIDYAVTFNGAGRVIWNGGVPTKVLLPNCEGSIFGGTGLR